MGFKIWEDTAREYCNHRRTLTKNHNLFVNAHGALPHFKIKPIFNKIKIEVNPEYLFFPGDIAPTEQLLQLRDGSFFTICLTLSEKSRETFVEKSVLRYVKVKGKGNEIKYVVHYDYEEVFLIMLLTHLQIEFTKEKPLPRFDITGDFVGFPELLTIIKRDLYPFYLN